MRMLVKCTLTFTGEPLVTEIFVSVPPGVVTPQESAKTKVRDWLSKVMDPTLGVLIETSAPFFTVERTG